MKRPYFIALLIAFSFASCAKKNEKHGNLEIARKYYEALQCFDGAQMKTLLGDSLATIETDYNYRQTFSKNEYVQDWLRWDSLFNPSYTVLEIEQDGEWVRSRISKMDARIKLLHGEPTVWKEVIRFEDGKITRIARTNVVFNDTTWQKNVNALQSWVMENHPELNGFLFDQTKDGGMKYVKAIELYTDR
ncbi:nuclear transport factor 2-like protein [Robiginitalea sediminis]|uniref:hypothetical protein n=1 Tax=Robiginitalea sediminis TaxID=1982593 RepID=UPI000B4B189D|nr:hypothetical protein [Robiginitalea sediminis]